MSTTVYEDRLRRAARAFHEATTPEAKEAAKSQYAHAVSSERSARARVLAELREQVEAMEGAAEQARDDAVAAAFERVETATGPVRLTPDEMEAALDLPSIAAAQDRLDHLRRLRDVLSAQGRRLVEAPVPKFAQALQEAS